MHTRSLLESGITGRCSKSLGLPRPWLQQSQQSSMGVVVVGDGEIPAIQRWYFWLLVPIQAQYLQYF